MKVLVLGGTGSIGSGIVTALLQRGHIVLALARGEESANTLRQAGATVVRGDLAEPNSWIHVVHKVDGVIHAAATWDENMDTFDRRVVGALLEAMRGDQPRKALIYTGGCWLFGNTGDTVATEDSPTDPLEAFAFSIATSDMVLSEPGIKGMVIHPGMVYEKNGGVFSHIYEDAKTLCRVRVIGGENVRWPLVHKGDLAILYVLMLEKGHQGDVYCAAAIDGYPIGPITRAIAQELKVNPEPQILTVQEAISEYGMWAEGYAIDQQMSGRKAMEQLGWQPKHDDPLTDI